MITALAHPNIALIKYWGKQDKPGNLPAAPNISITLDTLVTETTVSDANTDQFLLNGAEQEDAKVTRFIERLRARFGLARLRIESNNNFPTGAGLASSASGFAALIVAINAHARLGLNAEFMSDWARLGSASAARSLFGGFVALVPPLWRAQPAAVARHWPLSTAVAITATGRKDVSSSQGMQQSRATSPFYNAWLRGSGDDFTEASDAIRDRDFERLAEVAEHNCLKMHSVMLTTRPALAYWNPVTVRCMETVRDLRRAGTPVFFTIDAGPQVKAVCLPEAGPAVRDALAAVDGVREALLCGMGEGARLKT